MTRLTRLGRAVGVGLAAATVTLAMTQVANADPASPTLAPPSLPPDSPIAAPAGSQLFLIGHAKGVQTYTCNGAGSWGSSVPTADLVDDNGKLIVQHSKGPTWTAVPDGSAVSLVPGQTPSRVDSPAPARDIPWLLVPVGPAPTSSTTAGVLTGTTSIQRVNTQGGTAPPTAECKAQTAGKQKAVPYKADYYFYKATA